MALTTNQTAPTPRPDSTSNSNLGLSNRFFDPLLLGVSELPGYRQCPKCRDEDWLTAGVWRCLAEQASGRAFLQTNVLLVPNLPGVVPYFDALGSGRRLELVAQAAEALFERLRHAAKVEDPFAQHRELDGFWLFAGDGHYHAAAVHDPRVLKAGELLPQPGLPPAAGGARSRTREQPAGTKYATGHFFALDLRTHLLRHLAVADQEERRKEHDLRALKGLTTGQLRLGAPTGTKVLYVWDRAGIDFRQWHHWKQAGVYFLSLEKTNMKLSEQAAGREWDRADPRNAGVLADEFCMTSAGVLVRRVRWMEPESGQEFAFITSEMTLPPGLVAELYRARWNIERLFDETKTKLGEGQAWASSATAKKAQALFLCMAHNLMVALEGRLASEAGVQNEPAARRRDQRMKGKIQAANNAGRAVPSMWETPQPPTQRCVKFIRWLRCWFFAEAPWHAAVAALAASFASS